MSQTHDDTERAFFNSLPGVVLGASVVLRDPAGSVLLVEPTYRDDWILPGGTVEHDERPHDAAAREVTEELGLTLGPHKLRLLVIDWVAANPDIGRPTYLIFVFDGGQATETMTDAVELPAEELCSWALCTLDDVDRLMSPRDGSGLRHALTAADEHSGVVYLIEGNPVIR